MRIALFSLTGFANEIIPALAEAGQKPFVIVTRAEAGPFPHYEIPNVVAVARQFGIPCYSDSAMEELAKGADLLLVATYHRKVPKALYETCGRAINLHPSLLPKHPGRDPFSAVLNAGETETGITAHLLTEELDGGPIVQQWRLAINQGETSGSLRKRLAVLAATAAVDIARDPTGRSPT
jgi:methionyl-tRNA formyltransferase